MSYDLARLRRKNLITRVPHRNTYLLTPDGQCVVIFYTKVHDRLLRPLIAANAPPAPLPLRQALRTIDRHVNDYLAEARMIAKLGSFLNLLATKGGLSGLRCNWC
jgi:predicted MarR family transcription regulator